MTAQRRSPPDIRLPQAPKEYNKEDQDMVRRLVELHAHPHLDTGEGEEEDDGTPYNETLTFHGEGGFGFRFDNCPAAETYWQLHKRPWYDPTGYTHARVCLDVHTEGITGSRVQLQFTQTPDDDTSWAGAGFGGDIECGMYNVGARRGAWRPLKPGQATIDSAWRVVTVDGDGSTSPVVGYIKAEFAKKPERLLDRWYFRPDYALYTADTDLGVNGTQIWGTNVYLNFWLLAPPRPRNGGKGWDIARSTETDPLNTPRSLLRVKPTTLTVSTFERARGAPDTKDYSGWSARFVSPPLREQMLYGARVNVAFAGTNGSGSAAGYTYPMVFVVRPGVGVIAAFAPNIYDVHAAWFRFIAKQRIIPIDLEDTPLEDNDRIVVDIVQTAVTTGVVLLDVDQYFHYGGSNDSFSDGAAVNGFEASYIELPLLETLADVA